jgi:hypothetical protein
MGVGAGEGRESYGSGVLDGDGTGSGFKVGYFTELELFIRD